MFHRLIHETHRHEDQNQVAQQTDQSDVNLTYIQAERTQAYIEIINGQDFEREK
jgi:hypothetical protein